jgi:hypothetical protein
LTFKEELEVRSENTQEKLKGFFKTISKTADEVSLLNIKDFDDFFEQNKKFILTYLARVGAGAQQSERFSKAYNAVAADILTITYTMNSIMKTETLNPIAIKQKYAQFLESFETSLEAIKVRKT